MTNKETEEYIERLEMAYFQEHHTNLGYLKLMENIYNNTTCDHTRDVLGTLLRECGVITVKH